ncbi:hypothetical protein Hypma_015522 [Hypsizygus marmoreus]|uniref:Uncharacterized protein n=1 Tax=Hypsizygus marmoreus TaxID=39966 RepID=A0A369KD81_HYPMA|nr:hypothetical protein Hypma_015522 [Hypsizygus marmoreus]
MVSVISKPVSLMSTDNVQPKIKLDELGNLCDSIEPFTQLILQSGKSAVRLHCTVPTWSPASDICLDLHDLNELRSRSLLFIHDLLQSLRSSGVSASYCLAPSNSPLCLICAQPPGAGNAQITSTASDLLKNAPLKKRKHVLLADLESGPCLVIT